MSRRSKECKHSLDSTKKCYAWSIFSKRMLTTQVNDPHIHWKSLLSLQNGLNTSMDSRHCGSIVVSLSPAHHYISPSLSRFLRMSKLRSSAIFPIKGKKSKFITLLSLQLLLCGFSHIYLITSGQCVICQVCCRTSYPKYLYIHNKNLLHMICQDIYKLILSFWWKVRSRCFHCTCTLLLSH